MVSGFMPEFDPATDFVAEDLGTVSESEDCYFINPERPGESTHVITEGEVTDSIGIGKVRGYHSDGKPIILGWSWRTRDCEEEVES